MAVQSVLATRYLTSKQLGLLLDQFRNNITKAEVAIFCAPRLVDPDNGLGLGTKFSNSITRAEVVKAISEQSAD